MSIAEAAHDHHPIPPTAVVRVSRGTFDPARFAKVREMTIVTGRYLVPAIKKLPGLLSYYAATSPTGSMIHVSIWDSGVTFIPIVNYPIDWII